MHFPLHAPSIGFGLRGYNNTNMRCVVQRVRRGAVVIGEERRDIGRGLVVLVGIHPDDSERDAAYMADKVAKLRIFPDEAGKMNVALEELEHPQCLVVSQFTLYGDARRGRRPSFIEAARPETAIPLYKRLVELLRRGSGSNNPLRVVTGEFGTDMLVEIENDGPVTMLLDSSKQF